MLAATRGRPLERAYNLAQIPDDRNWFRSGDTFALSEAEVAEELVRWTVLVATVAI